MSRNVVLICLDTVRKDYFDQYAPRLQQLVDVSFDECRAAASWTVPSHASMLTGELAHQHGVHTHDRDFGKLEDQSTFLDELDDHRTIGVSANVHAGPAFGFDELFDEFTSVTAYNRFLDGMDVKQFLQNSGESGIRQYISFLRAALEHEHTLQSLGNGLYLKLDALSKHAPIPKLSDDGAQNIIEAALRHINDDSEPFFLFANFMDAHPPFQHTRGYDRTLHEAPNSWTSLEFDYWSVREYHDIENNKENLEYFRSLYAASIDYLDRKVSTFIEALHRMTDRETTVIVTADHGEELGLKEENYRIGHLGSLGEGLLHVPFCVSNPPDTLETTGYFSHLDLGTLITGLAREQTPTVGGDCVAAEVIGGLSSDFDAPISEDRFEFWNRTLRCTYDPTNKFVWDSQGECLEYDVSGASCFERCVDERSEPPEWCREHFLSDIVNCKRRAKADTKSNLDRVTRDQLMDLGYL